MNSDSNNDIEVKKSDIGQFTDGLGVFALRDFKKGEVVIKLNLKAETKEWVDSFIRRYGKVLKVLSKK